MALGSRWRAAGVLVMVVFKAWEPVPLTCTLIAVGLGGVLLWRAHDPLPFWIPLGVVVFGWFAMIASVRDLWRTGPAPGVVTTTADSTDPVAQENLAVALLASGRVAEAEVRASTSCWP